jgi:23S rRNA (cytidine2498-2'-O)-methyltransferase
MSNTMQSSFIATSNRGFSQNGQEELRKLFQPYSIKCIGLVPAEMFRFDISLGKPEALAMLKAQEPVFIRHIQPIDIELGTDGTESDLQQLQGALRSYLAGEPAIGSGTKVAVQTRKLETAQVSYTPYSCKAVVDELLSGSCGADPVVQDPDIVVSILLAPGKMYIGLSTPDDNLSDWPGGAVRFQKEEGQVSRAKFKLLEAERQFGLDYTRYRNALDIGAAPGGWTSLLLERGCAVTAVDPARLDPRVSGHPKLTYLSKNASEVALGNDAFDLLVCDMSWSPRQMTKLIKGLLYALRPGGTAVITVKLMHGKSFQTIRETVQDLAPELQLLKAKQLFHNREELTTLWMKG